MKRDSKLTDVLHVLLHLAGSDRPVTSDSLASMLRTNPVVVRRILSGLRKDGLVVSEKGHGGGWTIARGLDSVTLYDVFKALGTPTIFAMENRTDAPGCMVEAAVNSVTNHAFREAEAVLLDRFREVTLATVSDEIRQRVQVLFPGTDHKSLPGVCPVAEQELVGV